MKVDNGSCLSALCDPGGGCYVVFSVLFAALGAFIIGAVVALDETSKCLILRGKNIVYSLDDLTAVFLIFLDGGISGWAEVSTVGTLVGALWFDMEHSKEKTVRLLRLVCQSIPQGSSTNRGTNVVQK